MKFKLKIGSHVDHKGVSYDAPAIIKTDCDLVGTFGPEKFERIESAEPESVETDEEDVTGTFQPLASTKGAQIVKISGAYVVRDAQTGDSWSEGEKLTSQAKVKTFLNELTDAE